MTGRRLTVLLVDDDRMDAKAVRRAFRENQLPHTVVVVENGEQALAFLRKEGTYEDADTPALILLDLNMPVMNGIEFLAAFRSDPAINETPVVVLTTSNQDRDIKVAYQFGIGGFLTKPVAFRDFVDMMGLLESYWRRCELPPSKRVDL